MAQQVQDIMTEQIHTVPSDAALLDVARLMRDQWIGDVLVTDRDGRLRGIALVLWELQECAMPSRGVSSAQIHLPAVAIHRVP